MIAAARSSSASFKWAPNGGAARYRDAMDRVHGGELGDVRWRKDGITTTGRQSIWQTGRSAAWLEYNLWQGPAPEQPFQDNILHYNWHFFWHLGNGEIGNNGVHTIDLCRWALGVDFPTRVTAAGGRYKFVDDQQTPDTLTATWECNDKILQWEGLSWSRSLCPARRGHRAAWHQRIDANRRRRLFDF